MLAARIVPDQEGEELSEDPAEVAHPCVLSECLNTVIGRPE